MAIRTIMNCRNGRKNSNNRIITVVMVALSSASHQSHMRSVADSSREKELTNFRYDA